MLLGLPLARTPRQSRRGGRDPLPLRARPALFPRMPPRDSRAAQITPATRPAALRRPGPGPPAPLRHRLTPRRAAGHPRNRRRQVPPHRHARGTGRRARLTNPVTARRRANRRRPAHPHQRPPHLRLDRAIASASQQRQRSPSSAPPASESPRTHPPGPQTRLRLSSSRISREAELLSRHRPVAGEDWPRASRHAADHSQLEKIYSLASRSRRHGSVPLRSSFSCA